MGQKLIPITLTEKFLNNIILAVESIVVSGIGTPPSSGATNSISSGIASSAIVLLANSSRKGFTITNNSDKGIFVHLGVPVASATSFTVFLPPVSGGDPVAYYESPFGYTGVVNAISSTGVDIASGSMLITEFT